MLIFCSYSDADFCSYLDADFLFLLWCWFSLLTWMLIFRCCFLFCFSLLLIFCSFLCWFSLLTLMLIFSSYLDADFLSPAWSCREQFEQQASVLQQALGQLKSLGQRVSFASSRMDILKSRHHIWIIIIVVTLICTTIHRNKRNMKIWHCGAVHYRQKQQNRDVQKVKRKGETNPDKYCKCIQQHSDIPSPTTHNTVL